jgi:predicted AAA+ superfamily ATPase
MGEDPLGLSKEDRWKRLLENGNFPFPYHSNHSDDIKRWRNQRWSLLLREDLRDLESIKDLKSLELLAELLKNYAGGLLSYSNLAKDVEISAKTAKRWVQVLEKLYLIYLLTPFSGSMKRVLSKTPKVYFMDSGDLSEQPIGVQVENLVMLNLLKRLHYLEDAHGERLSLHYIRDKNGREVDFVIALKNRAIALIEVKHTDLEPSSALTYFKEKLRVDFAIQLHTDVSQKSCIKKGIRILSAQEFFDQPVSQKEFWKI